MLQDVWCAARVLSEQIKNGTRENGEKIRHKCCHGDHGDEVYNPIAAASCFYMFGEIANVFHLPELAAYFVELSTECFKV